MNEKDIDDELEALCKSTSRRKQPGEVSAKTALARELFMYGNGDGKPVRSVAILSEKSGAAPKTIETWLPVWKRESEAIARAGTGGNKALVTIVTPETVAWQNERVKRLKSQLEQMESVLDSLPVGSDAHSDMSKLYNATLKTWAEQSGYADHASILTTVAKEMIKTAGRADRRENDEPRNVTPGNFQFKLRDASAEEKE